MGSEKKDFAGCTWKIHIDLVNHCAIRIKSFRLKDK